MADLTLPEPQKLTRPDLGQKFLTQTHHYCSGLTPAAMPPTKGKAISPKMSDLD